MNAIEAQKTLDWRSSVALRSSMAVPATPNATYHFNSKMMFDGKARGSAQAAVAEFLDKCGLPTWSSTQLDDAALADIIPTSEQMSALNELHAALRGTSLDNAVVMERGLAEEGYGMPAIAALVLVVAVAVVVVVIHQNVSDVPVAV
jgi:hypothetical protein